MEKEFCSCRGCPQYWRGITDRQAQRLAEKTALNAEGNLANGRSGRVISKGSNGSRVEVCGPQRDRVIHLMEKNGGVRVIRQEERVLGMVIPLGETGLDQWGGDQESEPLGLRGDFGPCEMAAVSEEAAGNWRWLRAMAVLGDEDDA